MIEKNNGMKNGRHIAVLLGFLACLSWTGGNAQLAWQPVKDGLPYTTKAFYADGNDIYVGCWHDNSTTSSVLNVAKWNGLFWTCFPEIVAPSAGKYIGEIFLFNNEIYVYGNFDSISGLEGSHYLIRFNGSKWTDVGGGVSGLIPPYFLYKIYKNKLYLSNIHFAGNTAVSHIACWDGTNWSKLGTVSDGITGNGYVNQMVIFDKQLYIGGSFSTAGGKSASNIASWDETNWNTLGLTASQGVNEKVSTLLVVNNKLIVFGSFSKAGTVAANAIASWDGSAWQAFNTTARLPNTIATLNNELYSFWFISDSNYYLFKKWNGVAWIQQQVIFDYLNTQSVVVFNNQKWAIGKYKFHNDPQYYDLVIYDGITWRPFNGKVPGSISDSRSLLPCGNYLYLSGSFSRFNELDYNHIARLNSASVGRVAGIVYRDDNINCLKDSVENGIESAIINIQPGNYQLMTDKNGKYDGYTDTGFKKITLVRNKGNYKYYQLSPCNPQSYNLNVNNIFPTVKSDFALIPVPGVVDLGICLSGQTAWRARKGFTESYQLLARNTGTSAIISATASLSIDPNTTFQWSSIPYSTKNGNVYSWNFSDFKPGEIRNILIKIKIDSIKLGFGDPIVFKSEITPTTNDSNFHDNFDTLTQNICGSFDPNDKQCFPDGDVAVETRQIDYLIRFQNTGNDSAYRVVVIDSVETIHLPLTEIEIKTASHPYTLEVVDNVLIWTFNNILLPSDKQNEPASHGFIRYSAHIKPGLAIGTKIENTAYIFFDYQKHIKNQ